jgi:hypothetical protein
MTITSTKFEGSVTAGMSYSPNLGDLSEASDAVFTGSAFGDATLTTSSEGWEDIGDGRAQVRHQTNPVSGATVKAVQHQFHAADPGAAEPLIIDSNISTTFAGHLLLVS